MVKMGGPVFNKIFFCEVKKKGLSYYNKGRRAWIMLCTGMNKIIIESLKYE